MNSKDELSRDGHESEKKEDRSKKLADKLGPAPSEQTQQPSKDNKKESYRDPNRESKDDIAQKEGH